MIRIEDIGEIEGLMGGGVELASGIFGEGGYLESGLGLEYRPQQCSMAEWVERAFMGERSMLFEAGTGVGKSMAYLVPGIIKAVREKRPLIVSTHTKALQEQILHKDLGLCRELFKRVPELEPYREFKTAMLMGRGNYLCTTRLAQAIASRVELFPSEQQASLERIAEWAAQTEEGLIEEFDEAPMREVWEWVNADSTTCSKKNCRHDECFFQKAKAKLQAAQVIVVNHSLLFSLMSAGMGPGRGVAGVLYPEDFVVLDEAHTVADIATDHFGFRISNYGVDRALKMLYNPKRKKGFLTKHGRQADCYKVVQAIGACEEFFNGIAQKFFIKRSEVRLMQADWMEPILSGPLREVIDALGYMAAYERSEGVVEQIGDHKKKLEGILLGIQQCLALEPRDHVHWLEKGGRAGQVVAIRTAPIDVAPYLREQLFEQGTSVVLTSATLASAGGSMENYKKRIGAEMEEGHVEASPFDYENNVEIFVTSDAPPPSRENARLDRDYLRDQIYGAVERVGGGTLVLFTSYADLMAVGRELEPLMGKLGRPLLMQGAGRSRSQLVKQFKEAGNGVLLGTDSFWTGVDVPGEALSQVIITRLPFENPSHPVKQAQGEWLEAQGKHPFVERTLPEAVIKFRQGIGRLIRKGTDKGVITILDSRILYKEYGKAFLEALPKRDFVRL